MEKYECNGCHRHLFSYDKGKKLSSGKCPMCGLEYKVKNSKIEYDGFITDPNLKAPQIQPLKAPNENLLKNEEERKLPVIKINIACEPEDGLSDKEKFILNELLEQAVMTLKMIIDNNQVDVVAEKMIQIKRMMKTGIVPPM